jgi:beta-1,4-mannosyl-glycoprotein beta-1,4-N-acetylglucosaminyltransferase
MKIVDSFIFYNELDMLLYRLSILDKHIDKFILVESTHTFVGIPKKLFYNENKAMFKQFESKIVHVIVDDFPYRNFVNNGLQWKNEEHQRNCIARGINMIQFEKDDIILTSDLDEIPDPTILEKARNSVLEFNKNGLNRLELDFYYYNLNTKQQGAWHGIKLFTYGSYLMMRLSFEQMRTHEWKNYVHIIKKGGWHLSYFGDTAFIHNKLSNFSHQELKKRNLDEINRSIENSIDINSNLPLIKISVKDNDYLPPEYETYLSKYILY